MSAKVGTWKRAGHSGKGDGSLFQTRKVKEKCSSVKVNEEL